jgi:chorismate dehydratase
MTPRLPTSIEVPPLRLGVVPYLNVQPLIYGLAESWPSLRLFPATPARLEAMLARNEIDLGILPVFAAFLAEGRAIFPAPGIASAGPVRSVVIAANQPIEELRTIYRDPNSMTSNALAAVLIDRVWGGSIELVDCPEDSWAGHSCPAKKQKDRKPFAGPSNLPHGAGRLIIGDAALRERRNYPFIIDLAQAWKDWTGLPFVFAAWIGYANAQTGDLRQALEWTLQQNLFRLGQIAAEYALLPELSAEERTQYLSKNLSHAFGQPEQQAIETFHAEAKRLGLCPEYNCPGWL